MDLFEKCGRMTAVKETREAGIYPYFHALESRQDVEVMMEGKRRIMLGSNNYRDSPRIRRSWRQASSAMGNTAPAAPAPAFSTAHSACIWRLNRSSAAF